MKKTTLFFAISFVFFLCATVNIPKSFAQQIVFTVTGAKGTLKADGQPLKIGTKLKDNQTVTVGENSYLSLASTSNKSIEVTQQGSYEVKQLLTKANASQSLPKQYTDFVISELTKANEEGISAKNRFQHMNKSGSVKRGGLAINYLNFFTTGEQGHQLYGNTLVLMWYVPEVAGKPKLPIESYAVGIVGVDSSSYFQKNTKDTQLTIGITEIKNQGEANLVCKVTPLDKNGISLDRTDVDGITVTLMDATEKAKISAELKQLAGNTATSKLMQAKFFEDKKLYIDAMAAYQEAIKLSGNAEEYEELYYKFLLKYIKM